MQVGEERGVVTRGVDDGRAGHAGRRGAPRDTLAFRLASDVPAARAGARTTVRHEQAENAAAGDVPLRPRDVVIELRWDDGVRVLLRGERVPDWGAARETPPVRNDEGTGTVERTMVRRSSEAGVPAALGHRVAAMVADVLRPGWRELQQSVGAGFVSDGAIGHGFRITRGLTTGRRIGQRWSITAIALTPPAIPYGWDDIASGLDAWHDAVWAAREDG